MSHLVVTWGAGGSGKTTVAVNLACALSELNLIVGIIPANTIYGELQAHFGCNVSRDKGLHQVLTGGAIQDNYVATPMPNVFFLSLPNHFDCLNLTEVTEEQVIACIDQTKIYFDVLIVDGVLDLHSAMTYIALAQADTVVMTIKPSITASFWYHSMSRLMDQLYLCNVIPVINNDNQSCDKDAMISALKVTPGFELPHIPAADMYVNAGKPIYYQHDPRCLLYKRVISQIAADIARK
jgi:MinD-like ATPase involved in chromosome partitioning or flagellar assembly